MSFRFWRRIKLMPGVTLNLSKSGGSLSFGPRGAGFTIGPHGRRATVGLPGTGLYYTRTLPKGRAARRNEPPTAPAISVDERLTLGFFKRLITPDDEEALVDGCREMAAGRPDAALAHLEQALHLADGAYLAGFLALERGQIDTAGRYLAKAAGRPGDLGKIFTKYGLSSTANLPITREISAEIGPNPRGVLLGLVEVCQRKSNWAEAEAWLEKLRALDPEDLVIKLSQAELLLEAHPESKSVLERIVKMTSGLTNETAIHAALMLYKARALRRLGLAVAARDTLSAALRRKKGRSSDLLRALRYERARAYEDLAQKSRARSEFEKLYAEAPDYEDVARRLGL